MKKILFAALLISILLMGCTDIPGVDLTGSGGDNSQDSNTPGDSGQAEKAKLGDVVAVHYVGKLADGSIFDSSIGKDPLVFEIGTGKVIRGFEEGVIGMRVEEAKKVEIPPEKAYGISDPAKIITFDANQFDNFSEIEVGITVNDGQGVVVAKTDTNATINFNHRLAGKTLIFDIVLVSIGD